MSGCQPTISVIIPTYLRESLLIETISLLLDQSHPPQEIHVVDQTPVHEPDVATQLQQLSDTKIIFWHRLTQPNLPAARNIGIRSSNTDIVLFIDDDCWFDRSFIHRHVKHHGTGDWAAIVGEVWHPERFDPTMPAQLRTGKIDPRCFIAHRGTPEEPIDHVFGGNTSFKKQSLLAIGGFDERYVGSALFEDTDCGLRLWQKGYKILFTPDAWLFHYKAPSGGCRVVKCIPHPEWAVTMAPLLFKFRFGRNHPYAYSWWKLLRIGPLRKENILSPWRLPMAIASFLLAIWRAAHAARARR